MGRICRRGIGIACEVEYARRLNIGITYGVLTEIVVTITVILSGNQDIINEIITEGNEAYAETHSEVTRAIPIDIPPEDGANGTSGTNQAEEVEVNGGNYFNNAILAKSTNATSPVGDVDSRNPAEEVTEASETFEVTAYTSGVESTGKAPGDAGYGITASGDPVRDGYTLACPPSMDFGTVVEIDGVGERTCTDRGSAITEGRLDVYIADLQEAVEFGRRTLGVRIINEGER